MDKLEERRSCVQQNSKSMIRYFFSAMLVLCVGSVYSQNLSQHNWYFGNTTDGIRFNRGTNAAQAVTNQAIPFGVGGSAVATDPATGNLLFYTDGNRIYDACHLPMPNGAGLLGNSSANQPAVICPIPGQTNKYFVFVNDANFLTGGTIRRSVIDLSQLGNATSQPGLGIVEAAPTAKNTAVPGLTNRSEGMMIVPHANGTDYWLITHQNNSSNYTATRISATSYTANTFASVASNSIGNPSAIFVTVSNFSYNHKLRKVAVAAQSARDDALILDFNPAAGGLTLDRYIFNSGIISATTQSLYDIQWDVKGGQYLYISRIGETGIPADVLQYDYTNSSPSGVPTILNSIYNTPTIFRSYGLQLAPDSAIYHIYQQVNSGPFLVEKLTKIDTIALQVIKSQPFGVTNFGGSQFPSFLPTATVTINASFTTAGTCQETPISFFPDITPNADSLVWDFGDASTPVRAWSPVHKFTAAQTFTVSLTAFYQGQRNTITQPVTINPFDLKLQLVQDTTACRDEFPPKRGTATPATQFSVKAKVTGSSAGSATFNWSNGDTGDTLTPDSAGYYYVVATIPGGCSVYGGVNVKEYKLNDQRSNIWYFGNKAGIDFNQTPPVALTNSAMDAPAGCAIVCDRNGKTIFYTDGDKVYDRTDTQIDVGIGGNPTSTQSALIVAVPGDETLYYIFTTQEINNTSVFEVRYSIFDLKLNNGKGAVTKKNILLFSRSTERITSNGNWLVVHEYGNATFRTYRITAQGLGEAIYSDIGSIHNFKFKGNGQGYMKLGIRNNLAVPISTDNISNTIELFQLVDTSGVITNFRKLDLGQPKGQVYGIEFSGGGRKLFATVKGAPTATESEIYEYYLDSLDVAIPLLVQKVVQPIEMGALQRAPDGQIYMAINNTANNKQLGTINANENKISANSTFNFNGFALTGSTNSRLGLPNFIQQTGNAFGGPGFTFTGICLGDTTKFVGTPTDAIDVFAWTFGDGGSSNIGSPNHLYAAAGTYTVSMRLTNRCGLDTTIIQKVKINPPAPRPTIPGALAFCNNPTITLDAGPASSYLWTDGSTARTLTVSRPAFVTVTTTDANGCKGKATSVVVDNRPPLDLGPDIQICQNNATPSLNAQNTGAEFVWTLNGVPNGNISAIQVINTTTATATPDVYGVTVRDPITTCTNTDSKSYSVKVSPSFNLSKVDPTSCNSATGSATINFLNTAPAGGPYSFFILGQRPVGTATSTGSDVVAGTTRTLSLLSAGVVSAIVTDQISGCTISNSVNLVASSFTATATTSSCNPSTVTVSIASGTPSGALSYTFTDIATGGIVAGPQPSNIATLVPGNYAIQVRDASGCAFPFNQLVNPVTPTLAITPPNLCGAPPVLAATLPGALSFKWTSPTGAVVNNASINVTQSGTYTVEGTLAGGCVLTQSTTLVYNGVPVPDFSQSNGCTTQVTLTATPSGNYTYRWYKGGVLQAGGRVISLGQSEDGASYSVVVVDTNSGCTKTSTPKTIKVSGIVDAAISATQACQDGNPFTITATSLAPGVTYAWAFNNTPIPSQTNATLTDTRVGNYKVTVSKSGCDTPASIQISRAPLPRGILPESVVICNDPENADLTTRQVDLDPGNDGGAIAFYDWSGFNERVFTAYEAGIYIVDLKSVNGCDAQDQTEVLNECIPKIVGPNAFRPNSKVGENQSFRVFSFFISDNFEIAIFNRWGELVFQSKDKEFRWNGGYNNNVSQPVPGGTYSYVIRYESSYRPEEGIKEQRGGIVLLR
jgi:large repetitive protein